MDPQIDPASGGLGMLAGVLLYALKIMYSNQTSRRRKSREPHKTAELIAGVVSDDKEKLWDRVSSLEKRVEQLTTLLVAREVELVEMRAQVKARDRRIEELESLVRHLTAEQDKATAEKA